MAKKKRRTTRKKKTAAKVTRRPRKIKKKAVVRKKTKAAKISRSASSTRLSKAIKAVKAALPKKRAHRRARRKIVQQSSSRGKHFVRIKVIGIGGGGGNAITRMRRDFHARGVEFVVINTDLQDLESCDASRKLHIGRALTKGMGAGMNPELGQQSAEENRSEIAEVLQGADMVFLTAGFGGGTGTGATPVVAEVAREMGILTAAIVTKPFAFEGAARGRIAEDGLTRMKGKVDTLLIIPNDRIFNIIDKNTPMVKAFEKIDDILKSAVQGVAEIITASGLINVDFADVRSVMTEAGLAVIGVGYGGGADRAVKAIGEAINSPLLDISIEGARSVLFGVAGGRDLKMTEINEAAKIITDAVDPEAKIIFGAYNDRKLKNGQIKVIIIEGQYHPFYYSEKMLLLNSITNQHLAKLEKKFNCVRFIPRSKCYQFSTDEYEDIWHVTTNAAERFTEYLFQSQL